ncbi:type IV secretion system DNA-binding domain-containing protein [Patescibacteria group bacterium]|nr:type IV secretion system DNA-binding domain-containing protein [Patescibacteria group bacterium]
MAENDKDVVYFGKTDFRNTNRLFGVKRRDRRQHMYVIGKTGTGKSAMLNNLIVQDIANGEGLCVVDPHGELVEGILEKIPEERIKDVIYFNPADPDFHIGFNVLELPDPKYKHLAASGLMSIFTKIWSGVWSARMEYILNNAILALLDTPGSTLLGVTRLLVDKDYRQKIVANIKDPVVKAFWVSEYEEWKDQFRNEAIAPIQNKVGQFLSTAMVRNIVGQSKSTIDIFDIMNSGKIFLVNVAKGRIGEDNSALLGAMLITKIQLAAMERVRVPEDERVDFYLYVDEFQNFATDSFANILSEARKYRLNLILAHQYIGQLVTDVSTKVRDAVFGNVGTMITFRVGAADAEFLEKEYEPEFMAQDMVNLPNYHIYLKLMVDGVTSRPFSAQTLPPFKVVSSEKTVSDIIDFSRRHYAIPRSAVEEEIGSWAGMADGGGGSGGGFPVVCSSCGKETTVPFEPQPGRPVYCRDCLAKIKAGELKPVWIPPGSQAPTAKTAAQSPTGELANLGIEFETAGQAPRPSPAHRNTVPVATPVKRTPVHAAANAKPAEEHPPLKKHFERRPYPKHEPAPTYKEEAAAPKPAATISLSNLAPKTENNNLGREPEEGESIDDLRESLKKALSDL